MKEKYKFPRKDLTGLVYNKLTVLKFDKYIEDSKGRRKPKWLTKCECGNIKSILQNTLISGNQQSCGCMLEDFRKNVLPAIASKRNKIKGIGEGMASFNKLYADYKYRAKVINVNFSLSREEFKQFTSGNCFYCGIEPSQTFYRKTYNGAYTYNGIDRLNNNEGYFIGNIVSCCGICNKAKRDIELDNFVKWIKRITEYASKISFDYKTGN